MNREEARKAAEVMLAYADGKEIEVISSNGEWYNDANPSFNWGNNAKEYRIKPTPTYRPFANAEECWEEMKKHEPFGWIAKGTKLFSINSIECNTVFIEDGGDNQTLVGYFNSGFTFADGSVFGKLTEEE